MRIPAILQPSIEPPPTGSFACYAARKFSSCRLIKCNVFGRYSPYNIIEKIASLALKIFIVFPTLILCAAADLVCWIYKTITICCPSRGFKIRTHLSNLISILALPLLGFVICIAGKSPVIINRELLNEMLGIEPDHFNGDLNAEQLDHLGQIVSDGAIPPDHLGPMHNLTIPDLIGVWKGTHLPHIDYGKLQAYYDLQILHVDDLYDKYSPDLESIPMLTEAVRRGDVRLINFLLANHANPNLLYEAYKGRQDSIATGLMRYPIKKEVFALILEQINLELQSDACSSPLADAIMQMNFDCALALVEAGAHFPEKDFDELMKFFNQFEIDFNRIGTEVVINYYERVNDYTRHLMKQISPENWKKNVFFKAILCGQIDKNLMYVFVWSSPAAASRSEAFKKFNALKDQLLNQKEILMAAHKAVLKKTMNTVRKALGFDNNVSSKIAQYADYQSIRALKLVNKASSQA